MKSKTDTPAPHPVVFEEFFQLGLEESISPFITANTRSWGAHLHLKGAIIAALMLLLSFVLSYHAEWRPISHFCLLLVYFFAGIPSLIDAIEDLSLGDVNIDVLMTLAAFSSVLIGSGMEGGLLLVLFCLSGAMEETVTAKARSNLNNLYKLSPTKACVIEDNGLLIERAISDIVPGTVILIKSGQVVPLDGVVIEGISSVNLVHLTGENLPVLKQKGDTVPAGARNLEGTLTIEVTHSSADSTLSHIIKLVTEAQEAKPYLQRWFDNLSQGYAVTIILLCLFFAMTLPLILPIPLFGVEGSIYRALAFLIAASPCALIIAIPIAYLSAIGACARRGILLKGGIFLDALASCKAIAFDKTGTITTGELTCEGMEGLEAYPIPDTNFALSTAVAMERNSTHPLAKSILAYASQKPLPTVRLSEFKTLPGYGLQAKVQSGDNALLETFIGSADFITSKLPSHLVQRLLAKKKAYEEQGKSLSVLMIGTQAYLFHFKDTPRVSIKDTIKALQHHWDITPIMLTGDHDKSARAVAEAVGIKEYYADLKPEDKLEHVAKLSSEKGLAMIGDGINDAPALARATVGIGMGKVGSTAALDASDIILLQDNIEQLDWLFAKAMATKRIVRQNLWLAAAAIVVASVPALSGYIPLWLAVLLHEGGTVLVGLNGLRLLKL